MSSNVPIGHRNNTHHHHSKVGSGGYFARDEKLFWVLLSLVSVLPIILLCLRICRRLSQRNSENSIYTITKQDYMNLAPPRYSDISMHPIPTTYEKPPPYFPTTR